MSNKIPINQPGGPLGNPFDSLQSEGLPPGPASASPRPAPAGKGRSRPGRVVLRREKAHRGGKTVVVVHDFASHVTGRQIEELARKLKAACACGGTVKERQIEIQGDQPAKIRALLEQEGFRVAGVR